MINQQLKGRFESQRAFLGIYKEAFVFCGGRADKTEYKAKKLISRSVEFQRRSHFLTRQACVPEGHTGGSSVQVEATLPGRSVSSFVVLSASLDAGVRAHF